MSSSTKKSADIMMLKKLTAFIFSLALILAITDQNANAQGVVQDIEVKGAQRVAPETVISYLNIEPGQNVDRNRLNEALKGLFDTGLFSDITMQQEGSTLVVEVVENPIINQIFFEGNDKLDDAQLISEISLKERQVLTRTKVRNDVERLHQIYRRNGRFSVDIEPKVVKLDQNRVNLVFEVDEGEITKVKSIRFVGNEEYTDSRLRDEISTKETAWYRFISADDRYDPDRLSYDQELLRRFYLSEGYADFQIVSAIAELDNDKSGFYITITVDEGQRYKIGSVKIVSKLKNYDPSGLGQHIAIKAGEWYNANLVQSTIDKLTDALGDEQYAFVNIRPDVKRDKENGLITISFIIDESARVFVERIDVAGNQRTLDKVIRRELMLVEGDPFNKSKLARSEQRIRNLNFFEKVSVEATPGSAPDKTVIDVDVTEKSTGELSIGAGFSTGDGPLADLRIRERNLLGKGQDLLLSTTIAGERTEIDLSFTEPYFLDRDIAAGFDLFHITRDLQDESSFDQKRTGGALRIGYPLSERWRQTLRLRAETNEITDVQDDASSFIRQQEGKRTTIALSQRLAYDSRDSIIEPTSGMNAWLDTEITGLGGDSKYILGRAGASYYYEVFDKVVFNLLGEAGVVEGYGDEDVAINERFYLGGANLRGFEQGGIGPRDTATDDALGGNRFYRASAEFSFPIGLPEEMGVKGHTFADAGSLFDVDASGATGTLVDEASIRAAAGVGVSWRSPLGPIRVDFAHALAHETYDEEETFRFSFGTRF